MPRSNHFDLTDQERERAARLHSTAPVVDGLIATDAYLTEPDYREDLAAGGVTAANFTVASYRDQFESAVQQITRYRRLATERDARVVESASELYDAQNNSELGVVLGFQDTKPIANDAWKVAAFADLGVRVMQLTYNEQNYVGAGCCERHDPGLSSFGREVVDRMNDCGVVIDLSHCGDQTTMDAIRLSDDPVACTHVGVRELCDAPGRNKTDTQLQALADAGGVAGISFFPPLVKRAPESHRVVQASVEDVLEHIEYAVDLVGIDHVGIGTDLDDQSLDRGETPPTSSLRHYRPSHPAVYGEGPTAEYDPYPTGVDRHTKLETLTRGLVARGHTDEAITKILGGNFIRLFETVWD